MSVHLLHLWTFCQKGAFRFLKDRIIIEIANKMYKRGLFWALCISNYRLIVFFFSDSAISWSPAR